MKKIYLGLFAFILAGSLAAQTKTVTKVTKANMNSTNSVASVKSINSDVSNPNNVGNAIDNSDVTTALPGFPVYENTGNKELDDANYSAAKTNWIKENQTMYDEYMSKSKRTVNTPNNNETTK